jgi:hypothetical protein
MLYKKYKKQGINFCGISSYLEFPNKIQNPYEDRYHEQNKHNYTKMVSAWLHCFRDPKYLSKIAHLPNMLLTEADLKDTKAYEPDRFIQKEYDFIYICLQDNEKCTPGWQSENRNWELAKECLKVFCGVYGLKGLLVGRTNCDITELCKGNITIVPFLPFHEFQVELQKSKFLFVPNISDASPRVITEALSYNIPVLVNSNIYGGFHNVIPGITGEFFNDQYDVSPAVEKLIVNYQTYTPRQWFVKNSGKYNKGKELAKFLKTNFPTLNNKKVRLATITI